MENMEEIITEIKKIFEDNKNFKEKIEIYESNLKDLRNMNEELKYKNNELEIKVKDLEEKNNSKSSKLIWENTKNILKEKDIEIDKLKKDILYYERQNLIKTKHITNENNIEENRVENSTVDKKIKKSKKKINIINTQNDIDDLEKDLLSIK